MAKDNKCTRCRINPNVGYHTWCRCCINENKRKWYGITVRNHAGLKSVRVPKNQNEEQEEKEKITKAHMALKKAEEDLINFAISCRGKIGRISTANLIAMTDDFLNIKTKYPQTEKDEYIFQRISRDSEGQTGTAHDD